MLPHIAITGTDTDIGKTIFSAGLVQSLGCYYYKPIQAGTQSLTDSQVVESLSGVDKSQIINEKYILSQPLSPHRAAQIDQVQIDFENFKLPFRDKTVVIEGAGGLMVPISDHHLIIDLFARWQVPVILCARTTLGTINHSLLSLAALKSREIKVLGIVFIGDEVKDSQNIICKISGIPALGRLPFLSVLDQENLKLAMQENIDLSNINFKAST